MAEWTANPSADSFNSEGEPTRGWGTTIPIRVTAGGTVFDLADDNCLIRFDISTMPTTGIIAATLTLNVETLAGATLDERTVTLIGLTEGSGAEFEEGNGVGTEANWNNWGSATAWPVPGGASIGVLGSLQYSAASFDVGLNALNILDIVQAAVTEGYVTLGLLIDLSDRVNSGSAQITFSPREKATVGLRPLLTVETSDFLPHIVTERWTNFEGLGRSLQH